MADIGLHGMDLPDPAERLEMAGELRPAHRDPDAVMLLGERPHHMLADESRAAEDGDQHVGVGLDGHAALTARGTGLQRGACEPDTGWAGACIGALVSRARCSAQRSEAVRRRPGTQGFARRTRTYG